MKLAGTYHFEAPRQMVWEALQDPDILGQIMPGGQKMEKVEENSYKTVLKVKVGPVQGTFKGSVKLSDIKAPDSYNMVVEGRGQPGFVKGNGAVVLAEDGDHTIMTYDGDAQVGGRLASVGQRLMESSAKAMTKQALDGLHLYLKAQVAQESGSSVAEAEEASNGAEAVTARGNGLPAAATVTMPKPKIEIKQPTQTEFALGVAKNMIDDAVPAEQQPLLFLAIGFILGLIVGKLFSK